MICRAPDGSVSCTGANTGQQLSWDNEGRLEGWQNAPTSPTSSAAYLYDGEGHRVEQQTSSGGTTTTTVYIGDLESIAVTGGTTTTTTYYYAAGQRIALAVNGTLSYLASDLLGSASVALNSTGIPTASQLYAPYGGARYQNGVMPTDYGFTGQRADSATGLDYYGARYYDPTLGQFTSADTVMDGLNRYGYVGGNPVNRTDPSGHRLVPETEPGETGGEPPGEIGDVGDVGDVGEGGEGSTGTAAVPPLTVEEGETQITFDGDTVTVTEADGTTTTMSRADWEAQQEWQEGPGDVTLDEAGSEHYSQLSANNPPQEPNETPTTTPEPPNTPNNPPEPPNTPSTGGANPGTGSSSSGPNFVVTPNGDAITIPEGAQGPTAVINNDGLQTGDAYVNGQGGPGLSNQTMSVRIMYPKTYGKGVLQPGGYAVYINGMGQKINPITGRTIPGGDIWAHFPINLVP
jgi:RHS repeat-associated protein